MAWVKLDDGFASHPKALQAETRAPGALALWLAGACWCAKYETDGQLPHEAAHNLPFATPERMEALTRAGLWDLAQPDGYAYRNWLRYNIASQDAEAKRKAVAARVSAHRERNTGGNAHGNGVTNAVTSGSGSYAEDQRSGSDARDPVSTGTVPAPRALAVLLEAAGAHFDGEGGPGRVRLGARHASATGLAAPTERAWLQAWHDAGGPYGEAGARKLGEALAARVLYRGRPPSPRELCDKLPDLLAEALTCGEGGGTGSANDEADLRPVSEVLTPEVWQRKQREMAETLRRRIAEDDRPPIDPTLPTYGGSGK